MADHRHGFQKDGVLRRKGGAVCVISEVDVLARGFKEAVVFICFKGFVSQ